MKRLHAEDFKRVTVSFYRYLMIEDPSALRDVLFQEEKLQVLVKFMWQRRNQCAVECSRAHVGKVCCEGS